MDIERKEELIELAEDMLGGADHFDYFKWDHVIADGDMTYEELEWLSKNATVTVLVTV